MKLKRHGRSAKLDHKLEQLFGIKIDDISKMLNGNKSTAKRIGELGRQGRLVNQFSEQIGDNLKDAIQGTANYNKLIAETFEVASKSAIEIEKSEEKIKQATTSYENRHREIQIEKRINRNAEKARHQYALRHSVIKGYLDAHLISVDRNQSIEEQYNRPLLKQAQANEDYQSKLLEENLKNGDKARTDLIQRKDYQPRIVESNLRATLAKLRSGLGF